MRRREFVCGLASAAAAPCLALAQDRAKVARIGYLKDGRAVEYSQSYDRGDIYDFVAELSAST